MSKARDEYEKVMMDNDEYISMSIDNRIIRNYVSELEQEKAELIEFLKLFDEFDLSTDTEILRQNLLDKYDKENINE